jgi:hypothetical protein
MQNPGDEGTEVGLVVQDRMKSFRPKTEGTTNPIKRQKTSRFGVTNVLRVFPPVVEFHGIEVGTLYVMTLTVQNTGNTVRRVRFQAPRTSAFRIKQSPAPGLAPGLDTTVDIEFFAESEEDFHDKLIVTSGKHAIEVPLHAFAPAPKVVFDGFIDLGLCVMGQNMARYIEFKNEGMIMGEFNIEFDENLPITITPSSGVLHPTNPLGGGRRGETPSLGPAVENEDIDAVAALGEDEGSEEEGSDDDDMSEVDSARLGAGEEAASNNNGGGQGDLFPQTSSMKIKIEFHGEDLGAFRGLAKVKLNGQPDRVLDINAMLVEQRLELVLPEGGGQVATLPFGTLHFGMEHTFTTLLVNNGPVACAFSVDMSEAADDDDDTAAAAADMGGGDADKGEGAEKGGKNNAPPVPPVIATPADGIIQPYQQIPVVVTFAPRAKARKTGWAQNALTKSDLQHDFHITGTVQCVDTAQKITFTVTGRGVLPQVDLARDTFDFGSCPVHGRRDILTTVTNRGTALPVRWRIPRVAHFECKPQSGTLHPGQSTKLLVTFRPAQLGKFKHEMTLQVEDGAMEKQFRVLGHADQVDESLKRSHASGTKVGGPTSIPADFKPRITFVDENALKEGQDKPWRRIMPWEETLTGDSGGGGGGDGSQSGGQSGGQSGKGGMTVADSQYTFSVPDLLRRQAHRDQYHAYLKDARTHRLKLDREQDRRKKGLSDSDDPNSVDMGMQPRSGLRPPVPQLPEGQDPLWLEQPLTEDGGAPRRRVKLPIDDKRLIKHKFKPRATTPAEVRDVDCELTQAQLRDLAAGPTSFNFGKVVVHSASTRSFFVANNLNQSVLVALQEDGLDEELQRR